MNYEFNWEDGVLTFYCPKLHLWQDVKVKLYLAPHQRETLDLTHNTVTVTVKRSGYKPGKRIKKLGQDYILTKSGDYWGLCNLDTGEIVNTVCWPRRELPKSTLMTLLGEV